MISLPLVIMAGGKSSRMGSDKALLPFGAFSTLSEFQYDRLSPYFTTVYISAKCKDKFDFEASFIEDLAQFEESSPLIGLLSVLTHLKTPVCVLSVDTPFVTPHIFETLLCEMKPSTQAVIARSPFGSHQLCGIYTPSLVPAIQEMLQKSEHKIGSLLQKSTTTYVDFDDDAPFLNLNHPSDYEAAKARL